MTLSVYKELMHAGVAGRRRMASPLLPPPTHHVLARLHALASQFADDGADLFGDDEGNFAAADAMDSQAQQAASSAAATEADLASCGAWSSCDVWRSVVWVVSADAGVSSDGSGGGEVPDIYHLAAAASLRNLPMPWVWFVRQ